MQQANEHFHLFKRYLEFDFISIVHQALNNVPGEIEVGTSKHPFDSGYINKWVSTNWTYGGVERINSPTYTTKMDINISPAQKKNLASNIDNTFKELREQIEIEVDSRLKDHNIDTTRVKTRIYLNARDIHEKIRLKVSLSFNNSEDLVESKNALEEFFSIKDPEDSNEHSTGRKRAAFKRLVKKCNPIKWLH